ncbi:MAG: transporter substrate-binding domain-containing protein [Rubrivivax sp.]
MYPQPERFVLLDLVLGTEPVALMFRPDDTELQSLANEVLIGLMRSGAMEQLYRRWFLEPVPGLARPLDLAMSPALITLFADSSKQVLTP